MRDLTARLRDVMRDAGRTPASAARRPEARAPRLDPAAVAERLEGRPVETPRGPCVVIDRLYRRDDGYGRCRVGDFDDCDDESLGLLGAGRADAGRAVFFDLETTGLGGGAGSCAFLVGCGFFVPGGFLTRQLFLTTPTSEPALLEEARRQLTGERTVVSFNGKSFDAPLMESRWAFHRMPTTLEDTPHVDMLHAARRLWRAAAGCTLGALEQSLLGVRRTGDPDGWEIPSRYFHYMRTGELEGLLPVLEHNRLDLVSLAGLTARASGLVRRGPEAAATVRECLGLGRIYDRSGRRDLALRCFALAAGLGPDGRPVLGGHTRRGDAPDEAPGRAAPVLPADDPYEPREIRCDALRRLARGLRRQRRFEEAARAWRALASAAPPGSPAGLEAIEALAVHHEHRTRELAMARDLATRALGARPTARLQRLIRHRLERLDRKMARAPEAPAGTQPRLPSH